MVRGNRPRFIASPETLIFRSNKKKLVDSLPSIFSTITNRGVHNLSSTTLSDNQTLVLSLGLNFIFSPKNSTDSDILSSFNTYARHIRIAKLFSHPLTYSSSEFRVKSNSFVPPPAGKHLEAYLDNVLCKLKEKMLEIPYQHYSVPLGLLNTINSLADNVDIIIKQADKNLGVCVVDRNWYIKEALRQLLDQSTYRRITRTPTSESFFADLKEILRKHNKLNSTETKFLLQSELKPLKLSVFYMLIKMHKDPISGRPIVSCLGSPTEFASRYINKTLQHVMKNIRSYISDSYALSQLLEITQFPQDCIIMIADVVNLYPSIDINDGLLQLRRALIICNFPLKDIEYIIDLTHWVLTNNYFLFGDSIWHQIKGTAMGTPLAVVFANIYLAILELECFDMCKLNPAYKQTLLYKRFVDDKIAVFADRISGLIFIENWNILRPGFILDTFDFSDTSGIFMDMEFFKGPRFLATGHFDTKIYQKPMNSYLYIPPFSAHSKINYSAVILSTLKKYCMFSSADEDYLSQKSLYYNRLLARGYTSKDLLELFELSLDRQTLRDIRNNKKKKEKILPPIFTIANTPRIIKMNITPLLRYTDSVHLDTDSHIFIPDRQPFLSLKRTTNLKDLLVSSKFNNSIPSP